MKSKRRYKLLGVTPEFLVDLLKNEKPITISFAGLPADARVAGTHINTECGWIDLVIESASFPVLRKGEVLGRLDVTLTQHHHSPLAESI